MSTLSKVAYHVDTNHQFIVIRILIFTILNKCSEVCINELIHFSLSGDTELHR